MAAIKPKSMEEKANFPYKTLIWALFATLALFLFRTEFKQLISKTEEFSVFGVEIKASEEKANRLRDSIQNFQTTVAELSSQITSQQEKIKGLDKLQAQLVADLAACPEAQKTSMKFNAQVSKLFTTNKNLMIESDKLLNAKVLKNRTYEVKLIVPSDMVKADIYVDGQPADVVSRSGIFIAVRIRIKSGSHHFELKSGSKHCSVDRLITKDATEIPITCDS